MSGSAEESKEIAILDYGMGNLRSVLRAWEKVGAQAKIVSDFKEAEKSQALVFPGQGAIRDTMTLLKSTGWDDFIREWISSDRPFFGICLGLQALFESSEEGDTPCLNLFPGKVVRFQNKNEREFKIPHMGWNDVEFATTDLLKEIPTTAAQFYFVHSYYVDCQDKSLLWGQTEYGGIKFCSAIRKGNLVATQFHPEKSQRLGLRLYRNFLEKVVN